MRARVVGRVPVAVTATCRSPWELGQHRADGACTKTASHASASTVGSVHGSVGGDVDHPRSASQLQKTG